MWRIVQPITGASTSKLHCCYRYTTTCIAAVMPAVRDDVTVALSTCNQLFHLTVAVNNRVSLSDSPATACTRR